MVGIDIQTAQSALYDFFLQSVHREKTEDTLTAFRRLFIEPTQSTTWDLSAALHAIVIFNDEREFQHTLKRICYILINNWGLQRNAEPIRKLVDIFQDKALLKPGFSLVNKRLRVWLRGFVQSTHFKELKLFAARHHEDAHWCDRYTSYLLVPQYVNLKNPIEQRKAARLLSHTLREEFRFDLAMYTARSEGNVPVATTSDAPVSADICLSKSARTAAGTLIQLPKNPTVLGDTVLTLVKVLLLRPGEFSYANLANVFRQQVRCLSYRDFKRALLQYLLFALPLSSTADILKQSLAAPLMELYAHRDHEEASDALILRTCNSLINQLLTLDRDQPSPLFARVMVQGNPLYLVLVLLKISLFCRHVQTHLELRIADLIRYHEGCTEVDCGWVINFFEMFRITFAIFGERTRYNLVRVAQTQPALVPPASLDDYRIFSQMHHQGAEVASLTPVLSMAAS
ncbi:MAG: hypothetical protein AAF152_05490 [Cyanobacteria bacterium P01_A01_bin.114]